MSSSSCSRLDHRCNAAERTTEKQVTIQVNAISQSHWNYLAVLEDDLLRASRYVEFAAQNFETYSIEFAHLLFAAAAETEVILKELCQTLAQQQPNNIDQYRAILLNELPQLPGRQLTVPRFGLQLQPWSNWGTQAPTNPDWWRSYNNVKHARHQSFEE